MNTASFDKAHLLEVLNLLKITSAGAKSTLAPLTHIYFDGEWAFTYDGKHLSRVPFASPIQITAPLSTLLALVTNAKGKNVNVKVREDGAREWRCGKGSGRWETLPFEAWLFKMDSFSTFAVVEDSVENQNLATAMRAVIPRVAEVASADDHTRTPGIRVKANSARVVACATDDNRAGIAHVSGIFDKAPAFVVPESFSKILKNAPADGLQCYQSENWFGLRFADGYEIFTRLLIAPEEADYGISLMKRIQTPDHRIAIDETFIQALKSINDLGKDVLLTIRVENGAISLCGKSKSPAAELDLQGGMMAQTTPGSTTEGPPDVCVSALVSHLIKLLAPDTSLYVATYLLGDSDDVGEVLLIDGHGAHFAVSLVVEELSG